MASKDASKDAIKDTLRGHFECAGSQGRRRRRLRNGKYEEPLGVLDGSFHSSPV